MTYHAKDAFTGQPVGFRSDPDPDGGGDQVDVVKVAREGDVVTSLSDGRQVVATPGTPVQLTTSSTCRWVQVTALPSNTNYVYVGGTNVLATAGSEKGQPLAPGAGDTWPVTDPSILFVDALVADEGVTFTVGA